MEPKDIMNHIIAISKSVAETSTTVKRLDDVAIPEIQKTLTRMESKQNKDILQFISEKEALNDRIKPLEADLAKRQGTEDRIRDILWRNLERFALWAGLLFLGWYKLYDK